jgi:hypothetical protein
MTPAVERIVRRFRDAEEDLSREVAEQRKRWRYRTRHGRVWFAREARQAQRRFKRRLVPFIRDAKVPSLLTAPILYSLIVPLALVDFCITTYQWACFPLYGIPRVRRRSYLVIDRHRLAYLNGIEKINCTYCSYANGLIAYVREVAARTEQYWCPIKHARPIPAPHSRYHTFFDYGDAEGYRRSVSAHPPAR